MPDSYSYSIWGTQGGLYGPQGAMLVDIDTDIGYTPVSVLCRRFSGSRGDSLAFRGRSWYAAAEDVLLRPCILSMDEFILGDAGFALTPYLVCSSLFLSSLVHH